MSKKVNRRDFLKLASTAVAGTALASVAAAPKPEAFVMPPQAAEVTVRVGHWWGDAFKDCLAAFEKANPKIKVKEEAAPWAGYADKLLTMIAAGNAPDANFLDSGGFGVMLPKGIAADITSLLATDKDIKPEKWAIDPAVDTGYKKVAYGLPQWHPDSANIAVNKDLFEKAGIKVPAMGIDDMTKWTWKAFVEACQALTKKKADGKYDQWGIGGVGRSVWSPHRDMVWSNGAEFFDDITHMEAKKALFTEPAFVEAWQWLVDLNLKLGVATTPEDEAALGTEGAYLSGKVGMVWMWNLYGTMKKANFAWTVIAPPISKKRPNKYGGNSWTISSVTKQKDAAWTFIKWAATSLEGVKNFALKGTIPAYDPEALLPFAESEGQKTLWQLVINRQKAAVADKITRPFGLGVYGNQITDILNAENDLIYNNKQTVAQGLKNANDKANKVLAG